MPEDGRDKQQRIWRNFFTTIFNDSTGYLALANKPKVGDFTQGFFQYPSQLDAAVKWIGDREDGNTDLYFCPMLFGKKERRSEHVTVCPVLWGDLDTAKPEAFEPVPQVVLESSPGRWQALWRLNTPAPPQEAAQASRRLAYAFGADLSGWDLTQLLRIPATRNAKYAERPVVQIVHMDEKKTVTLKTVMKLPEIPQEEVFDSPLPEANDLPSYEDVLDKYRSRLPIAVSQLHDQKPLDDFSKQLWHLELLCFESGLSREETFAIAETSAANKYARDKRSRSDLWTEVCKAQVHVGIVSGEYQAPIEIDQLLTDKERAIAEKYESFVDRYVQWAVGRTDAPEKYHEAAGFVLLSTVLAENIRLGLASSALIPNLWFMILGDTTTTRKTTTIEMALELLSLVYDEAYLASEATVEGLLTALSTRSGRSSLFVKDEFSGMLESMKRKDYFSGMSAMLARLYDGRHEKRVLRQATYEVRDPILIMYCGGAKSRIYSLMDQAYIIDGFLPRFIFITAETDVKRLRPLALSNGKVERVSSELAKELSTLHSAYDVVEQVTLGDETLPHRTPTTLTMTQEALDRFNEMESHMIYAGQESSDPDIYLPTMQRLAMSGLRAATLLAAARSKKPEDAIIELKDMLKAISYVEGWLPHTLEVMHNVGKTVDEKTMDRIMRLVRKGKTSRTSLMQSTHLSSKDLQYTLEQMEAMGMVVLQKAGKTQHIYPTTAQAGRR